MLKSYPAVFHKEGLDTGLNFQSLEAGLKEQRLNLQ